MGTAVVTKLRIRPQYACLKVADLSRDQLLEVLEASDEGGIKIGFRGRPTLVESLVLFVPG